MKFKDVLIGIVVVILIYIIYVYLFSDSSKKRLIQIHNAEDEFTITRKKLPMTRGQYEYSFSIWFFISNWTSTSGTKTILFMSDKPAGGINDYEWSLTLGGTVNSLQFNYRTGNKGIGKNSCEIPNIPIQRWTNVIVGVHQRSIDLYLDGKLINTCITPDTLYTTDNESSLLRLTPRLGGKEPPFQGFISNWQWFGYTLSPQDAYNIYKEGYKGGGWLSNLLNKYKIKIAFLTDNKEVNSFVL